MNANEKKVETEQAYWLDGSPYCVACVESETAPCMSAAERERATLGDGIGACACCGRAFPDAE